MNALFAMIFLKVWKQNTMDECRNLFLPRSLGQILTFASVNAYAFSSHNVISLPYSFMGQTFYSIVRVTLQNIRIPLLLKGKKVNPGKMLCVRRCRHAANLDSFIF